MTILVRALARDHREGVHALGQRIEILTSTGKDVRLLLKSRLGKGAAGPVQAFPRPRLRLRRPSPTSDDLIRGMKALPGGDALDGDRVPRGSGRPRPRDVQRLQRRPDRDAAFGARLPRRQDHPHGPSPPPDSRSEGRSADCGEAHMSSHASRSAASRPTCRDGC